MCKSVKINLEKGLELVKAQFLFPACHLRLFSSTKMGGTALKHQGAQSLTGAVCLEQYAETQAVMPCRSLTEDSRQARILGKAAR